MDELVNALETEQPAETLETLAVQAQAYSFNAALNLFKLAEVLIKAKAICPKGRWGEWVKENAHIDDRRAQEWMQAYRKLGGGEKYVHLGVGKILQLMNAPEDVRDALVDSGEAERMTVRELKETIRREVEAETRQTMLAEFETKLDAADARVRAAEERAHNAEREVRIAEAEIPAGVQSELEQARADLEEAQVSASHFGEIASKAKTAQAEAEKKSRILSGDLADAEETISAQQDEINRLQEEILAMRSEKARGSDAAPSEDLTPEVFAAAVRQFVGLCARLPYMAAALAAMPTADRNRYSELLATVEGWCEQSRRAVEAVQAGGVIVA